MLRPRFKPQKPLGGVAKFPALFLPKSLPEGLRLVRNLNPVARQVRATNGLPEVLGRIGNLLMGSTAMKVVQLAEVPVTLIK